MNEKCESPMLRTKSCSVEMNLGRQLAVFGPEGEFLFPTLLLMKEA